MDGAAAIKPSYAEARQNMVDNQLRANKVVDDALIAAMGSLPREDFVPERLRGIAYVDEDLPLGGGRFLMEPMVLARLIQATAVAPTDKVLVLGAATGYSAAVLASLARGVVAVEADPALAERARRTLGGLGFANVTVEAADPVAGFRPQQPYDVILIEGAVEKLPPAIFGQLAPGGRLATVVVDRGGIGEATLFQGSATARIPLFDAATPVLPGFAADPGFEF